jgi:hypothetical protein
MATSLTARAPQARCYRCGSLRIDNVCHHCRRPICADHTPQLVDRRGRPLSAEFTGLELAGTRCGEAAVHCPRCQHVGRRPLRWLIAVGMLLVGAGLVILLQRQSVWLGLPTVALGIGVAAAGIRGRERRETAKRVRPTLPLLPRFDPVSVSETLQAHIRLRPDGSYRTTAEPATGRLTIAATFAKPDRERVQQYRRKFNLGERREVAFHLGFALLQGPAALAFEGDLDPHDGAVLPLTGQVRTQPFLNGTSQHFSGEWRRDLRYRVSEAAVGERLLISLTPSLVQASGRRVLDLDLQWDELDADDGAPGPTIDRVESLELRVPLAWGPVRQVSGNAAVGTSAADGEPASRSITWLPGPVTRDERQQRRRTFEVQFDNQIDLNADIRGRVEVSFKGALSGLVGVDLYYPLGGLLSDNHAIVRTHVVADFKLSLAGVRYQDVRFVPDSERPSDVFEGVIPDHTTIVALTDAISEQGYYVKRVLENPPRTGSHANLVNRCWDIAGRIYRGVYPVDFHLVVTGEEVYDGGIRAQAGTTETTLTVQGAFATSEMEGWVEATWEQLHFLISETLEQRPRVASADDARQWRSPDEHDPPYDGRAQRADVLRQLREHIDKELGTLLEED